ncbi:MAG: DUF4389 domain-containing protein [Gammaproteobacteria bacterium]|nr:DUF4389 domain-containing protein [Gammaproteobacteria bacterium]
MATDVSSPEFSDGEHTEQASGPSIWHRALYMVLFAIIFHLVELIIGLVMVVQFVLKAATGKTNENLGRFGDQLSQYLYKIVQFQTFNTEDKPFPFQAWPKGELND